MSAIGDFWRDLWIGFRSHPVRTILAFLCIALGNAALSMLIAVAEGLSVHSDRLLREFGGPVVVLTPADAAAVPPALTRRMAETLAASLPEAVVSGARRYETVSGTGDTAALIATDAELAAARGWTVKEGRFLDERDVRDVERNVVLSSGLANAWGARVGAMVSLGGALFRVVGVISAETGALREVSDHPLIALGERVAFIPWTTADFVLSSAIEPGEHLDAIFVRLSNDARFDIGWRRLERLLGDPRWGPGAVARITPENILRGVQRLRRTLQIGLGGMTGLALTLGGIAISGLLAGNVRERVSEIGLRRALGATRADVAALFVAEGLMISVGAALVGVALAWMGAPMLAEVRYPMAFGLRAVCLPVAGSAGLGLLASFVPARMAAHLDPATALRAE